MSSRRLVVVLPALNESATLASVLGQIPRTIEGIDELRVVVIDDVVTTGGSALLAVDRIVEFGCEVVCVVGIVDRKEGGAANFAARNLPFRALLSIEDFGITPPVSA